VALVQFGWDQISALESHRFVAYHWTARETCCKRYVVSRESPVMLVSLWPSSDRNEMPVVFIGPRVSKARGWKMWEDRKITETSIFISMICSFQSLQITLTVHHRLILSEARGASKYLPKFGCLNFKFRLCCLET